MNEEYEQQQFWEDNEFTIRTYEDGSWLFGNKKRWKELEELGKLGYWNYVRLRKWKDHDMFIEGYRADPVVFEETEQQRLFDGTIKNKSELIKLMQQLNIK